MNVKTCFKCEIEKPLTEFYKHKAMGDGYLGKCKDCTKKDTKERLDFKLENEVGFHEKEKARHRDKYYRLGYKEKHKPTPEKKKEIMDRYKEKYPEKTKAKNLSQSIPCTKGNHLHHWSYALENAKDVIELTMPNHALVHRYLKYNQPLMMYSDLEGNLLDTRAKHLEYINVIIEKGE